VNLEGKSIYPSFIDMYTTLNGKQEELKVEETKPLYDTKKRRLLLNEHIKPETEASANLMITKQKNY
jgi:hypothetical protein